MHHCDCNWQEFHDQVKEQFDLEVISPKKLLSSEDKRAVEIVEQACQNKSGKYEVGLIWRNDLEKLPESRATALKRLQCMRKRIPGDLYTKIDDQIKNLLLKRYAKQLTDEEAGKDEDRTCCAPFIAHYVRNKNAELHQHQFPIRRAHYLDDFIDSMSDEEKAIEIPNQVKEVHARGGFEIRQFSRLKRDDFIDTAVPTKTEVLQVLMSLFDPLGLLSCHTIGLKILLQKIWRANIYWDEELPESLLEDWKQWKLLLSQVATVSIPRCYSMGIPEASRIDLHTFVDSSEHAYSAACYLRVQKKDKVDVMLVVAKSKVAPLKPLSIPRMELEAAEMGSRLAKKIVNVRNFQVDSTTFWSNSRTFLQWLVIDPRHFQQFVMHRLREILETTRAECTATLA
ncbi:uncharacterized protein [Drosophila kikkawai]|uniref:Reverse transcriptase domain-containing protein n=1 Tax=Drosophila kikkawai TaxID=30033 RepID=A0ABM4GCK8_DROKI